MVRLHLKMNYTALSCSISAVTQSSTRVFTEAWVSSLELRIAVFVLVLQCCIMVWATSLVREIMRTTATVLCKLLVYDCEALAALRSHTARTGGPTLAPGIRHKTAGGPPPTPHPADTGHDEQ